jgi:hypothetical protein
MKNHCDASLLSAESFSYEKKNIFKDFKFYVGRERFLQFSCTFWKINELNN